jgi:Bifunctional DNA primase/polymerase, N-terminal
VSAAQADDAGPSLLEAALAMAARGWHLLPVGAGREGKAVREDLCPRWSQDSTTDPQVIASWLAGAQGVGIAVDLSRSGLAVVDGDHLEHLDIPRDLLAGAWTYQGNRERMAWLFTVDPARPVPSMAWMPWGEVKAAGSYVILPPSPHHTGVDYRWLETPGDAPPVFPEALRPYLARPDEEARGTGATWTGTPATPEQAEEAVAILVRQCRKVAATPGPASRAPGAEGRNQALNRAAFIVGRRLWALGDGGEQMARDSLLEAAKRCGLVKDDGELVCRRSIRSGLRDGAAQPVDVVPGGLSDASDALGSPEFPAGNASTPADPLADLEGPLFDSTPTLAHIRQAARARRVSPWAVLGNVLAICSASLAPRYVLPAMIGGAGSLSLAVALVAGSGGGKSTSTAAAMDLYPLAPGVKRIGPGTGEGLVETFLRREKDAGGAWRLVVDDDPRALLLADEIAQVAAVNDRNGSTFASIARTMLTSGPVSTTNADPSRRRHLDAHTYRLAILAGVQPRLAGALLDDADAGTPQRWLWLPADDPSIPDERPEWPGPLEPFQAPGVTPGEFQPLTFQEPIRVPAEVRAFVDSEHVTRQRTRGAEGLSGHAILTRLKVAALLGILHGQGSSFDLATWDLAGIVLEASDRMRAECQEAVAQVGRLGNKAKAWAEAEREAAKGEWMTERAHKDAKDVHGTVERHKAGESGHARHAKGWDGCPEACITVTYARLRDTARRNAAIGYAVEAGWLRVDRKDPDKPRLRLPGPEDDE